MWALVAGEAWALILTAERTLKHREEQAAPLRAAELERNIALKRLSQAEDQRLSIGATTPRLDRALSARAAANQAVVEKSAERRCAGNCRRLLEQLVEAADLEVKPEEELSEAREAFASVPAHKSASLLADKLGVASW